MGEDELARTREADCLLLDVSLDAALEIRLVPDADDAQAPPDPVGTMSANMMDLLNRLPCRKVLAHLAPESPWLDERGAAARRALQRQGIELAHDGMEIEL